MTYAGPSGSTQSRQPFPVSGVPRPKRETRRCSASRPPRAASASRTGTGRRGWACSSLTRSANPNPNPNPYRNPNHNPNPNQAIAIIAISSISTARFPISAARFPICAARSRRGPEQLGRSQATARAWRGAKQRTVRRAAAPNLLELPAALTQP